MSLVYLIHIVPPYKHAGHYVGFTKHDDPEIRLAEHRSGSGANLTAVAVRAGCELVLARVWPGESRKFERRIKNGKMNRRRCPICKDASRPDESP